MTAADQYRPELDGLRAVAVSLVVLYHAGFSAFKGGFVGVDVFFVLSGYFMAAIIARDLDRGRFRFSAFYARRIRRILPALIAVFAVTTLLAWKFLMPQELEAFARSLRAAALMFPNVQFERESGYFGLGAEQIPLLHTWSLGVEEQFYLIFPLMMFLAWRFGRRMVLTILLLAMAASFGLSWRYIAVDPTAVFYLLPYRVWELLLGAAIALRPLEVHPRTADWLSFCGLAGILASAIALDSSTPFPGPAALLPCLSTALLVLAGSSSRPFVRLLSTRPFLFVGKASYSIYLWHWPIIVFLPFILPTHLRPYSGLLIIGGSLAFGYLSWRFIEQPFRVGYLKALHWKVFIAPVSMAVCAVAFAEFVLARNGLPERLPDDVQKIYSTWRDESPFFSPICFSDPDGDGLQPSDVKSGKLCRIGDEASAPVFVLWGDSHAAAIAPALDVAARRHGVSGLFIGRAGCPPLPDTEFGPQQQVERCREFIKETATFLERRRFSEVFLAAYWPKYVHRDELPNAGPFFDPSVPPPVDDWSAPIVSGLTASIRKLSNVGSRAIIIHDVPEMGYDIPEVLARAKATGKSLDIAPPLAFTLRRQELARKVVADVAAATNSGIIDPMPEICDVRQCRSMRDGTVLYKDEDHLSLQGALTLSSLFDEAMEKLPRVSR